MDALHCVHWRTFKWVFWVKNLLHTLQEMDALHILPAVYDLLHTLQVNGCSPLCVHWRTFKWVFWVKDLLHTLQEIDALHILESVHLPAVCDLLYTLQVNGRSPLCVRWHTFRWVFWVTDLLHTLQVNGRSPLCVRWRTFRWVFWVKDLLHALLEMDALHIVESIHLPAVNDLLYTLQVNGRSPLCKPWCALRELCHLNDLLHTSQVCSSLLPCRSLCSSKVVMNAPVGHGLSTSCICWCSFEVLC